DALIGSDCTEQYGPQISPDGKRIGYLKHQGELWTSDVNGNDRKQVAKGPWIREFEWAPTSEWLVYTQTVAGWETEIFVVDAEGRESHNISLSPLWDMNPVWSQDGSKIAFLSNRDSGLEREGIHAVWQVFLTDEAWEAYLLREDGDEEKKEAKKPAKLSTKRRRKTLLEILGMKKRKAPEKPSEPELKIDFDGIENRTVRVTHAQGNDRVLAISSDGKQFAFISDPIGKYELFTIDEFGRSQSSVAEVGPGTSKIIWGPKDESLLVLADGGQILWTKPGRGARPVGFSAEVRIDHKAEWRQMFDEAWREVNTLFYSAEFDAEAWAKIREGYLPLVDTITTHEDFRMLLYALFGELSASHFYIWPNRDPDFEETAHLGLEFDPSYAGDGLRAVAVVPDGPCDQPGASVMPGEILLQINGQRLSGTRDAFGALKGQVGRKVDILVKDKRKNERLITVRPSSREMIQERVYDRWVASRKAIVDKASGGAIGYIHIPSMDESSYRKFLKGLVREAQDKKALIIDVRYNEGGDLHDKLLSILGREQYLIYRDREGAPMLPQPRYNWNKPVLVMINEYSGSDAELFPYSFRERGIGKLVGVPTGGSQMYIMALRKLIDGTYYMLPTCGAYTLAGKDLENTGIAPDIYVENPPEEDFSLTSDTQLERAVEELMKDIK
ncbi:MAG: PD40 domain-containing protein, partial [Candidatus Coatesbacteria bacterium]|nr:PD40 domain-containing protein [Candidatus Coatesbacteria bacterium]